MELAALIVSFGVPVVSGVAAAVAVVQAREAATSRRDAGKARDEAQDLARVATAAFVRQAEAQEKANAMKEEENRPAPWTRRHVSGDLFAVTNTSTRTIQLIDVEVYPDGSENFLHIERTDDNVYEYGDSIEYATARTLGGSVKKLTFVWRFADESDDNVNRFIVPL